MKRLWRVLLILLLLVVALGVAAPFLSANRMRPRIQAALESALNRHVHLGEVHLSLFTGPGFTVKDVLIDDDPAAGIEPFAHVGFMQARLRFSSLLTGKLAFSSLRLDQANVNLVKLPSGAWNIQPLLEHSTQSNAPHRHTVPEIQINDGRLSFKFGDTKSIFYISEPDVDIYPNQNGDIVIRFSGNPGRTDRGTQTFGEISARGLLHSGPDGEDQLNLGLHLERTAISELMRLFNGPDRGIHGFAIANARLAGPLSRLDITGDLNVTDIHRWDLMPPKGEGWTLNYRGSLDLRQHQFEIETVAPPGQMLPVSLRFRVTDFLSSPKWAATAMFLDLPAASLLETARHVGAPLPPDVQVNGKVQGSVGYSSETGLQGLLSLENATVKFPRGASAEFTSAPVLFENGKVTFGPGEVRMDNGQSAGIVAAYAFENAHATVKIGSRQLTIAQVESSAQRVIEAPPIPLLERLSQGTLKGWIAFDRTGDDPGVWSGEYDLQNAVLQIPGVEGPLRLATASVEMKDGQIQISHIRAHTGDVLLEGDYRYDPAAARPHRVRLTILELQLSELERLMLPTLRRNEGFLARTFRIRPESLPKWLQERELEGNIQVVSLLNGDAQLGSFKARVVWDGPNILLSNVDCRLNDMHATGKIAVNVAQALPTYQLSGTIENLDYRNGQLDLEGDLQTAGFADRLLLNIQSQGTFEGREIALGPETVLREVTGSYRIADARLLLSNLQLAQGPDTFSGQGSSQPDGHVTLDLTTGHRQVRMTGMLLPMHPDR